MGRREIDRPETNYPNENPFVIPGKRGITIEPIRLPNPTPQKRSF